MFDWENAIALHAMQGNRASSRGEGECLLGFLELWQGPGYILELQHILNGSLFNEVRTPV